jgi:ribosomal protein S18 acetylase RimI-like enzyme
LSVVAWKDRVVPVVRMNKTHVPTVARLHRASIRTGLTASLGQRFCERLYWGLANTPYSFVLVYEEDGLVLGFVCGATNVSKMYRSVLRRRCFSLALGALSKLRRPSVLGSALTAIRRPKAFKGGDFACWNLPEAELVSIGVDPQAQGKRVGTQLVEALFDRLMRMGCNHVRVWTSEENERAVRFYQKCGFRRLGIRTHHSGDIHVFVADLTR